LDVAVNVNSNPASTEFAIQETSTGNYVQAGGTLGGVAVWQTATTWGTKTVTGLTTGTTYTFQVMARNGGLTTTAFGATASGVPVAAPTVTTQAASVLAATTATGNGNITATNGANATARGVIYYAYTNTDLIIGGGGVTNISGAGNFGTGAFTASLTPLTINTQYNARAYATSVNGTGYGARVAFWTLANVPSAPTVNNPTATTLDVAVNINGNPATTEFAIQETSTGNYVQADGSLAAGQIWQTTATWGTRTVTGLTTGTTYIFQVKARNGASTETAFGATTSGVAVPPPTVTGISPSSGPASGGSTVTITGANLTAATAVKFGAVHATGYTVNSATQITATAPVGSGSVHITVTTAGGTSATGSADQFTYVAAPTVTVISPNSGPTAGGTSVIITGTNLTGATGAAGVKFGSTNATSYTVNSATQITATAPAGSAGTVDITVATVGGISATGAGDQFTYNKNTPTLSVINTPVTYDGAVKSATVTGSIAGTVSNIKYNASATVPANAGTYAITADFAPTDSANYNILTAAAAGNLIIDKATPTASITNTPVTFTGSAQTAAVACLGGGSATLASGGTGTNAGSYAATVDCAASANYNAATGLTAGNFVIDKATPTASITNTPVTFTGSAQTATVACLGGGTATLASGGTGTSVGSYPATVNCAASANYNAATGLSAGVLVIGLTGQTITFAATVTKPYGDADFGPGATASSNLAVTYTSDTPAVATITATGLIHITGAGTATITASQAGNNTYTPATAQLALTVTPATLNVKAQNIIRAYATANPAFTPLYSGFVNGETATVLTGAPTFTTSATTDSPIGSYAISATNGTLAAANYTFTFADATLAVGIASQTITFNPLAAKTYGDATFDLAATGGPSGAPVAFTSSNPAVATITGTTVTITGAGTTTITANQAGNSNYASATAQQELTVNKATLTITAQDTSRPYNTQNPVYTNTITGFVNNETATVVSGAATINSTADISSPVGSYPIIVTTGTLAAANYTFTFVNGAMAIGLASQNITFNTLTGKTYGDPAFDLAATGGASGNPVSYTSSNPAVATISGATVTIIGAGTTTITANQTGTGNYAPATAQQTLAVAKAALTVTANKTSRIYGTTNPLFTATISGFVNNETETVLSGSATLASSADATTPTGNYPITAAAGNLFSTNYNFSYINGTIAITPATPVLTWNTPAAVTYGTQLGNSQLNATANVAGVFVYTPAAGTTLNAGTQTLTVSFTPTDTLNYTTQTATISLAVGAVPATITLGNLTQTYDGRAKTISAVTTPAGLTTTITYNGSNTAPSAPGSYTVVATVTAANYTGSATGTLTIGKSNQTISAITLTPNALITGSASTVSATASSGQPVTFMSITPSVCTISGTTVTGVNAGTCILIATQNGDSNYLAASISQILAVGYDSTPPTLIVSALSNGATTTESTQNISGMAIDRNGIATLTINGAGVRVNPNGSFTYPVQLLAGANTITTIATNLAGITASDTRIINLDSTAPHLTVTYPPDNTVAFRRTITVTGTIAQLFASAKQTNKTVASAATTVSYSINGSTAQSASITDATYSFTTTLDDGMNTIRILAANTEGKTVESKRTVNYQLPTFALAITDPASDIRMVGDSYLLSGTVADNTTPVTVTINMDGQNFTPAVTNGVFMQQLTFAEEKTYQISVTGTDQNNNSITVQRNIIRSVPKSADGVTAPFTIVDALLALQISAGIFTPNSGQTLRMDVAPMINGVSVGDGLVDIEDAIIILRMAAGLN
jgi:hypothetical protein